MLIQKKTLSILFAFCFFISAYSQQGNFPDTKIKSLKGEEVSFRSIMKENDTAIIVSLWATWCVPCIRELEIINEQYEERQKETPFRMIAISVDDTRTSQRVRPFIKGRGWNFEFYQDINSDLKRALNINDVPHILLIKNGKILYQHNGYVTGNEEELFEKLRSI